MENNSPGFLICQSFADTDFHNLWHNFHHNLQLDIEVHGFKTSEQMFWSEEEFTKETKTEN